MSGLYSVQLVQLAFLEVMAIHGVVDAATLTYPRSILHQRALGNPKYRGTPIHQHLRK